MPLPSCVPSTGTRHVRNSTRQVCIERARQRLIEAQVLTSVYKSVVRIGSAPNTLEGRCAAVCLGHPSGFITGPTGGKLLGLWRMPRPEPMHLAVPAWDPSRATSQRSSFIRRHRSSLRTSQARRRHRHRQSSPPCLRPGRRSWRPGPRLGRRADSARWSLHDGMSWCHRSTPVPSATPRIAAVRTHADRRAAIALQPSRILRSCSADALRSRGVPVRTTGPRPRAAGRLQDPPRSGGARGTLGDRDRRASGSPAARGNHQGQASRSAVSSHRLAGRACHRDRPLDLRGLVDELVELYEARIAAAA